MEVAHSAFPIAQVTGAVAASAQPLLNKERVENMLLELQDSHRLAIHMVEDTGKFVYPKVTLNELSSKQTKVSSDHLISMSLLPSRRSEVSIIPYGMDTLTGMRYLGRIGYMMNLDQNAAAPATVACVSRNSLNSGMTGAKKDWWAQVMQEGASLTELQDIYAAHASDLDQWYGKLNGAKARELSQQQLDALGDSYDALKTGCTEHEWNKSTYYRHWNYNELLVLPRAENIAAISAVINPVDDVSNIAVTKLAAAVAGMQHLQDGIDLPVVAYHVGQERGSDAMRGKCEYWAQGRQELFELALAAVADIQKEGQLTHRFYYSPLENDESERLEKEVKKHFGIDLFVPLAEQQAAIARTRESLSNGSHMKGGA